MQALLNTHCKATLTKLMTRRVQQSQLQELRGHQPFCVQEAADRWLHTHALQNHFDGAPSKLPEIKQTFSGQTQCEVGCSWGTSWCQPHTTLAACLVLRLLLLSVLS
jgi:hypothetical protein